VKHEGKNEGKYVWMNPNTSTCPRGVRGMMRMMVKGTNASKSCAVRRSAETSLGFKVPPVKQAGTLSYLQFYSVQHYGAEFKAHETSKYRDLIILLGDNYLTTLKITSLT
jgi:hypothetical protein